MTTTSELDGYVPQDSGFDATPLFSTQNGSLSISAPIKNQLLTTFGNPDLITRLKKKNPNNNQVVEPVLSAGGYILGTDIILGSLSTTTFLSNTVGTYIYNNLSVSGNINNNNLTSALNSKATNTQLSNLDYTVSTKADQTDLITNYYNKFQADSLLQGKANANNVYSIGQVDGFLTQKANVSDLNSKVNGSDVYLRTEADLTFQTKSDMFNYATFEDLSNFETIVSMLGNVYQTITGMSSYVTTEQSSALISGALASYVTSGTLVNKYATQIELSEKVDYTVFEQQLNIARDSAISNSYAYTDNKLTNYITSFSPLSGTYLSILDGANIYPTSTQLSTTLDLYLSKDLAADTFQDLAGTINSLRVDTASTAYQAKGIYLTDSSVFQLAGNYLTNSSAFQLSGNYLTNASAFQLSGNYLTDASVFQLSGNYITTFTPLAGTYLSIIDAGSTYQTIANMSDYITSGSLTKVSVGLGNVDNTSDVNKPVSTATQTALNLKANLASPSFTGTVSGITPSMIGLNNVRPWVAGYVWNNGASVTNSGVGQYNATSSRNSTGVYTLSFPTVAPKGASNLTCIWSPNTSGNFVVAMNNGNTVSTATVMARDSTNTAVEAIISFVIWCAAQLIIL